MAAKFVVAVALFAVCSSSPVLINGVVYRDGRAYSIGQAYNYNGGASVASANVNGDNAQAYGSTNGNQLARDGFVYPGQAIAQAQTYDVGAAKAVAQAHNGYYPVPAPATVITYEQNFAAPSEVAYEIPGSVHAHSSAVRNGVSDSSISSATTNGAGVAESSANTGVGSYGATSSNAKTYGGYGHADSKANSGYGSASTSARTQGQGSASSNAQTNGVVGVVYPVAPEAPVVIPAQELPSVIDVKTPIFHTAYVPVAPAGIASSNANVVGSGSAASSAKLTHGRTISWRFGTAYDVPAPNSAQAQASTYGQGIAKSHANTNGYGSANADADVNSSGYGSAKSTANSNGAGSANANADVHGAGYGAAKSAANTSYGSAISTANSNAYGHAKSAANVGGYYGGSRTSADAHSHGYGSAASSARAQPVSTAYRVANSQALSSGSGYARANAQTA
ncbi:uncharacterized protein LOC142987704 [Anticarsia gemmatalis]|uniref:uncharacterized protein LOC142987704 n=1 Tax=Anticarsia gemmatalis TaxID=129554 RepID=UPI003F776304